MPGVHQVAALLKRWILGPHQGSFAEEHLQSYLEEYTFRFNRRKSNSNRLGGANRPPCNVKYKSIIIKELQLSIFPIYK